MQFQVSIEEIPQFAQVFWEVVSAQKLFLFFGEMGAGKTTLIEALCAAKGVKDRTSSPTFSIINQYSYSDNGKERLIYHIDLYRLKDEEEIIAAGVDDCVYSSEICFVEWPQKALGLFDETATKVHIETVSEKSRRINLILPHAV